MIVDNFVVHGRCIPNAQLVENRCVCTETCGEIALIVSLYCFLFIKSHRLSTFVYSVLCSLWTAIISRVHNERLMGKTREKVLIVREKIVFIVYLVFQFDGPCKCGEMLIDETA